MKLKYLLLSTSIAAAVGLGGLFYLKLVTWSDVAKFWSKIPIASSASSAPKGYIAIYLTNGKVYFGKIEQLDSEEPVMSDVFFLNATKVADALEAEFQLVRLADQFQAPVDRLTLTRDHVLYWEELSDDSKVVQAIVKYHETQK